MTHICYKITEHNKILSNIKLTNLIKPYFLIKYTTIQAYAQQPFGRPGGQSIPTFDQGTPVVHVAVGWISECPLSHLDRHWGLDLG
jgi:hypothetical protein